MQKQQTSGGFARVHLALALAASLSAGGLGGCTEGELLVPIDLSNDTYLDESVGVGSVTSAIGGAPIVVYLNFRGAMLTCGGESSINNQSFIICDLSYPPMDAAGYACGSLAACEQSITDLVREQWAPWNIIFVTERPTSGSYEMVMIGGAVGGGAAGVAPLDCGNNNPNNISFAFSGVLAGSGCADETLITTISQELAHALGLCHNNANGSVMFPALQACNSDWICGNQIDTCQCVGFGYDPFCPSTALNDLLGPAVDDIPPVVSFVGPTNGASVAQSFEVTVDATDERGDPEVFLYLDGLLVDSSLLTPPYSWTLLDTPTGSHTLEAIAWDDASNMADTTITIEVVDPGTLGGIGDICVESAECGGGTFCAMQAGEGYCTDTCVTAADCPESFTCDPAGAVSVCWPPEGWNPRRGCGCRVGVSPVSGTLPMAPLALVLLVAASTVLLRRRRTDPRRRI